MISAALCRPSEAFCLGCYLLTLPGCWLLPVEGFPGTGERQRVPTPQEILVQNFWESGVHGGKLWDRAQFLVSFPSQLLQISNLIEESGYQKQSAADRQPVAYPQYHPSIQKMLDAPTSGQKVIGLEIMETQQEHNAVHSRDHIGQALAEKDPYVRMVAVHLLAGFVGQLSADDPLWQRLLQDDHEPVRLETVRLLRHKNDRQTLPLLYIAIRDKSPWVRGEAAALLGDMGDAGTKDKLRTMIDDEQEYVREQVSQALRKLEVTQH